MFRVIWCCGCCCWSRIAMFDMCCYFISSDLYTYQKSLCMCHHFNFYFKRVHFSSHFRRFNHTNSAAVYRYAYILSSSCIFLVFLLFFLFNSNFQKSNTQIKCMQSFRKTICSLKQLFKICLFWNVLKPQTNRDLTASSLSFFSSPSFYLWAQHFYS